MQNKPPIDRAWVEINFNHLQHNIEEIKKIIPPKTKIMAVVKANAYGHGIVPIAKFLNSIGITDFAVATMHEGITLRENHIVGNILILGYNSLENMQKVIQYDLIQTIVDEEHAIAISQLPFSDKIKVHLKINTGMNRIGFNDKNFDFIKKLYKDKKLNILGIFSHLCACDSEKKADMDFSRKQIERFHTLIQNLKKEGIDVGKTHLQSSYGIANYSELEYDYVRPGIFIYGVHAEKDSYCKTKLDLKPVLTLKARISSIKEMNVGDSVGYGRSYVASKKEKIATVTIGYADGYPRNLSNNNTKVIVNNKIAHVIGKICMDQLIINIDDINQVAVNDIVTLIGESSPITVEEIALQSGTITYELLSRLGNRLNYIYKS